MSNTPTIQVFGEPVEILVTSRSTHYTCCVGIQTSQPGDGPPPHKHERNEETFIVLEGAFDFFNGQDWTPFKPGEVRFSPRGKHHGSRNAGTTAGKRMFITNAGGLDGYFALIPPLELPRDFDRLTEISKHYGSVFLPMPSENQQDGKG